MPLINDQNAGEIFNFFLLRMQRKQNLRAFSKHLAKLFLNFCDVEAFGVDLVVESFRRPNLGVERTKFRSRIIIWSRMINPSCFVHFLKLY